jgi:hypothetical protein
VAATALVCCLSGAAVAGGQQETTPVGVRPLAEVLRERTDSLMSVPGVVGTAEGLCNGTPCIKVFVSRKTAAVMKAIPASVEGYPVAVEETGELRPFQPPRR